MGGRALAGLVAAALLGTAAATAAGPPGETRKPVFLPQSWTDDDRSWFYTVSQGSQIMPYAWFMSLERPDGTGLFVADALARFGYLPNPFDTGPLGRRNPDRLPVGFAKDVDDRGEWIGMTCAACHTGRIEFKGRTFQVDGAPAGADMFAFIAELGRALARTTDSQGSETFRRFAARVLGARTGDADRARLFREVKAASDAFATYVAGSTPPVAWGPARLDAFGMIFNRATGIDLGRPDNIRPPDAPVSYPFLWSSSWHDWVQWNAAAPNTNAFERLGRNVGEVLGVFAHTDIGRDPIPLFYRTSARKLALLSIENRLRRLTAPRWPRDLAPIDAAKAAAGGKLYGQFCVSCHLPARTGDDRTQRVTRTPLADIGTDPVMTTNAATREAATGPLEGVRMPLLLTTQPLPERMKSIALVQNIVVGSILQPIPPQEVAARLASDQMPILAAIGRPGFAAAAGANRLLDVSRPRGATGLAERFLAHRTEGERGIFYLARPLDGIWATAPYLHNGSVANLYQLLLPSAERLKSFTVGSRVFDPVAVGFATEGGSFTLDTSLRGNSNAGHEGRAYGTDRLTEKERWDLVEYLKTL